MSHNGRREGIVECPNCARKVGGVALIVGVVKVTTFSCPCGRAWRIKALQGVHDLKVFVGEIERLSSRYYGMKPPHIRAALSFLQTQLDAASMGSVDAVRALKKKREDLWERQFMKQALGED